MVGRSTSGELDYQRLFESSPGLFLVLDPQFNIVGVTDAYLAATMTQREAIIGRNIFDVFPDNPDDPNADGVRNLSASLNAVLAYKVQNKMDVQKYDIRKEGTDEFEERYWSPVNSPILDENGDVGLIVHRVDDVTEIMRLGRAESDLHRFFSISLDMLCISSGDGKFRRVSPAFTDTLGWSDQELTTTPFIEFVHPDDIEATMNEVDRQLRTGESVLQFENRYRHKDGSWRTLSWKSQPQPDGLMYATARDVTQAKLAQRELEVAQQEAERANNAKSEFLSRMSHELRTPLNGVLGYAQLLEMYSDDEETVENARAILNCGRHLLGLINEVLDLARIEAGKLSISVEPVSVQGALAQAIELVKPTAEQRNIRIELGGEPIFGEHVLADSQRLIQILVNLMSNAVKFNQQDGKITISCYKSGADMFRVEVSDTGFGIKEEHLENLFKPFERLGNESIEGTGLGLALSNSLAHLMGGEVKLKATGPEGSTFVLSLVSTELKEERLYESGRGPKHHRFEGQDIRVVYIEDNLANIDLLKRASKEVGGVEFHTALDAKTGIKLVEEILPNLVLLDLHLPDAHGSDVLNHLQLNPATRDIPVVIISADATKKQVERMLKEGASAYLTKPIDLPELLAQFEKIRRDRDRV